MNRSAQVNGSSGEVSGAGAAWLTTPSSTDASSNGCMAEPPWREEGFEGLKLAYLAAPSGFFCDKHRALADA